MVERRRRVIIAGVKPEVDGGRFPIKRTTGESIVVEADVYADGHDAVSCAVLHKHETDDDWQFMPMAPLGNDCWRAEFPVTRLGRHLYTVEGWIDAFKTWRRDLIKRIEAEQDVTVDLLIGARLIREAAGRAEGADAKVLAEWAGTLEGDASPDVKQELALADETAAAVARYPDRRLATRYDKELVATVDREKARFSSWYELFPRSCADSPARHGTFRDVESRLDYIASMGFDVLYLPPIHPIGKTNRKGKNNSTDLEPGDTGSPWAIGSEEGGHKAIHPELGAMEDFEHLVAAAAQRGLEIALDIAFQCSPDHPYVKEHPEWFRRRPDGTIQYAENPPKKYQDIYPLEFETEDWRAMWDELKSVVLFWIGQGHSNLPRRQSAHQGVSVLGMGDCER